MYQLAAEELVKMGAEITTREIRQQPELWAEAFENYKGSEERIAAFLNTVKESTTERIRVVFTGAGTSQYVGDILVPYLSQHGDTSKFIFQSIGTTDIVSSPEQ